jgi:hypothetical protein
MTRSVPTHAAYAGILFLGLAGTATAQTTALDFESVPCTPSYSSPFNISGFTLTEFTDHLAVPDGDMSPIGFGMICGGHGWAGSKGFWSMTPEGGIRLTRTGGGPFAIKSIDLSMLENFSGFEYGLGFTGYFADGSAVHRGFLLPTATNVLPFASYSFGSEFDNIVALEWYQGLTFHQFDDIVVTATPEPSTVLLLATGLLALAAAARRWSRGEAAPDGNPGRL